MSLRDRLQEIEGRIENAAQRAGRRRDEITLIAVSKVFPAAALIEAYEAGARHFGENYVQEFESKYPEVKELPEARFHLIGHLQSNKSRRAAEMFHSIDTVDSGRLARRLEEHLHPLDVFLEVKLSEEEAKAGVAPAQLGELIESVRACRHLTLRGLMTMPPWSDDAEAARPYFQRLRELAASHGLTGLSMGMSHDFEVAIAEGATHIRIGTALFGPRVKRAT